MRVRNGLFTSSSACAKAGATTPTTLFRVIGSEVRAFSGTRPLARFVRRTLRLPCSSAAARAAMKTA